MTIKLQKVKYKRNIIKWIVYELNIIVVKHHICLNKSHLHSNN